MIARARINNTGLQLSTISRHAYHIALGFHLLMTAAATLGFLSLAVPFWTAITLYLVLFFRDQTIYFVYSGLILMIFGFLSPLILFGAPIALKIPPNGSEYDQALILSLFWFAGIFSFYVSAAESVQPIKLSEIKFGRTDAVTYMAAVLLVLFSALMLQNGTLLEAGYRNVTAERDGFIEFASLITLAGICAARSRLALNVLIACALIYLATTFLVGLRLRFISVGIVLFCCLIGIKIRQGWKLGGLLAAIILFVLGMVRNAGFSATNLAQTLSIESLYKKGALVSTAGGAFQTSKFHAYHVTYGGSGDKMEGLYFLLGDIISIFTTRGVMPDTFQIKSAVGSYLDIPGGGLLPGYFFAYMGIAGVIVLSIAFTLIFTYILRSSDAQAFPYQVILAAYAPRILLYDWAVGFKMIFYFYVMRALLLFFASLSRKRGRFE